jgi:hypothetical protein
MGILDDAIKEHLELKRQHGADASELKQLEDEAFGAAERPGDEESAPDPLAEAPTEFMQQPEVDDEPARAARTEIADLQEAPAPPEAEAEAEEAEEHEQPAEEDSPAMEHDALPDLPPEPDPAKEPEPSASHTTAEREAIAEHPTEMYDIEEELGASEAQAPSDEELVDEKIEEPDDFFDEKRLSDELDQALEAPAEEQDEPSAEQDELAEDEYDEEPEGEEDAASEALRPAEGEEDVLEETPDFLEEAPEDDRLWFEQKPPKDFDFDD